MIGCDSTVRGFRKDVGGALSDSAISVLVIFFFKGCSEALIFLHTLCNVANVVSCFLFFY